MSDQIVLEYLFRSTKYIHFESIFHEAAQNGELYVMHKLFDRGLVRYDYAVCTAAETGHVEWLDKILRNWDFYVKTFFFKDLTSTLKSVITKACKHNHMNIIKYVFEENQFFPTYYSQHGDLLEQVEQVKPDPTDGLEVCTTLEFAQYFASKGATNFHDCMLHACVIGNLDMLKYALSMYKSLPKPTNMWRSQGELRESYEESLFRDCLRFIVENNYISLLEYLSPYCYDLTRALYTSLQDGIRDGIHADCCTLLVRAINEDKGRFRSIYRQLTEESVHTLLNYGLCDEIMEQMAHSNTLKRFREWRTFKCELLKRQMKRVLVNDVFSLFKSFVAYERPPSEYLFKIMKLRAVIDQMSHDKSWCY